MQSKICTKCKKELPLECFNKGIHTYGRSYWCKQCNKISCANYHKNNRAGIKEHKAIDIERKRTIIDNMKAKGCLFCNEKEICCLEFHHIEPDKKLIRISGSWNHYGLEAILKEIIKCVLVCANCHKKIHAGIINIEDYEVDKPKVCD